MKSLRNFALFLALSGSAFAQAPGVPIVTTKPGKADEPLLEKAKVLREAGKLLKAEDISALLKAPAPGPIQLPAVSTTPLRGRQVAERARKGYVQVGWYFLCKNCEHWHISLAGGYAIAQDTVATCHHCVEPSNAQMREGYLVAADSEGNVMPVTSVLAKSKTMDCAILRVEGGSYAPLPLNADMAPGDPTYLYSEPLGQEGYFSTGIVNRFYYMANKSGSPGSADELKFLRVNVSTDWAPGSSGAAVLDECANVVGHVSTISPMSEGGTRTVMVPQPKKEGDTKEPPARKQVVTDRFGGATLITLHEAVPAKGTLFLAHQSIKDAEAKKAEEAAKPVEAPKAEPTAPVGPEKAEAPKAPEPAAAN